MLKNIMKLMFLLGIMNFSMPGVLFAHCDTWNGPVIADARKALESGDVTTVLKWVQSEYEPEVKQTFQESLAVRSLSTAAKDLADRHFFETLVRLHRAGEGVGYSGISTEDLEPVIAETDKTLETGSIEVLLKIVTSEIATELQHKFKEALERKKNADQTIQDGREFVKAYVEYLHYVEALHKALEQDDHSH